jgi:hypothetical protein
VFTPRVLILIRSGSTTGGSYRPLREPPGPQPNSEPPASSIVPASDMNGSAMSRMPRMRCDRHRGRVLPDEGGPIERRSKEEGELRVETFSWPRAETFAWPLTIAKTGEPANVCLLGLEQPKGRNGLQEGNVLPEERTEIGALWNRDHRDADICRFLPSPERWRVDDQVLWVRCLGNNPPFGLVFEAVTSPAILEDPSRFRRIGRRCRPRASRSAPSGSERATDDKSGA